MFKTLAASINLNNMFDTFYSGVVLLNEKRRIICCNQTFAQLVGAQRPNDLVDKDFYTTLQKPRFTDGDYCPLHLVETKRRAQTRSFFVVPAPNGDDNEARFYDMVVAPYLSESGESQFLVAIQDVTETARDDRRLQRLSKTRHELYNLLDETTNQALSHQARLEKLKALVKQHMNRALRYDFYEMRLLKTDKTLEPFLSFGMPEPAQTRELYASPSQNGITGYVASCGESYICEDVTNDPYYIIGAIDALSSITLPIRYLNQTLAVVNVESLEPNAFTRRDLRFLELYLADVAQVLHQLDNLQTADAQVRAKCAERLSEKFFDSALDAASEAFERCVPHPPKSEAERATTRNYAQGARDAVRQIASTVDNLANAWRGRELSPGAPALFVAPNSPRILLLDRERRFLQTRVAELEALGLRVDVASLKQLGATTNVALEMLKTFKYDLVVSELYPDGKFFNPDEEDAIGLNPNGCNLYDIHLPGYRDPVEGNARDAEIRGRVISQIAGGKRDAYFLYQAILEADDLPEKPKFLFALDDKYDPTHNRRDLVERYRLSPKTTFIARNIATPKLVERVQQLLEQ